MAIDKAKIIGENMGLFRHILNGEGRKNLKKLSVIADKVIALAPKY